MQKNTELTEKDPGELSIYANKFVNYLNNYIDREKMGANDVLNILSLTLAHCINSFVHGESERLAIMNSLATHIKSLLAATNDENTQAV